MNEARKLHISGIVQGVGFRPFIFRHAKRFHLNGWVLNAIDGVHVHIEGDPANIDTFINSLKASAPAAARIDAVETVGSQEDGFTDFTIHSSEEDSAALGSGTLVSPDIATCPECLKELFADKDRRYHYPFINCTNCGPRFTIIDALPYDRKNTSMADFEMCSECSAEYHDPADRRFHAQPDACFACGPRLKLWRPGGESTIANTQAKSDRLIEEVVRLLKLGKIIALKGLGGYHLACDATNERAVAELRRRKRRTAKPFAVMLSSLRDVRRLCEVNSLEEDLLTGSVRPIVLLRQKTNRSAASDATVPSHVTATDNTTSTIAPSVSGNLVELGVMLPYTPLQHLIMSTIGSPLIMTSGNISEEPIIAKEGEAHELLRGIADAFLDNDRDIYSRYDDSVVRVIGDKCYMVRRARGYAPVPVPVPVPVPIAESMPTPTILNDDQSENWVPPKILATGPEQKSTFCLVKGDQAFVSQHLGDLENAISFNSWQATLALYKTLFDIQPQVIVHDIHPEYLTSKWARAQDEPRIEVQHHHAHIASILAEHKAKRAADKNGNMALVEQVIGIAFDGTGYGDDKTIWGGEVLIAGLASYKRFAQLCQVVLPGGAAAIEYPNRMAWSYLKALGLSEHRGATLLKNSLEHDRLTLLDRVIEKRLNSPMTSSMGRLFDAVSAMLGICNKSSYEGQAAIELEAAIYNIPTPLSVTAPPTVIPAHPATTLSFLHPPLSFLHPPLSFLRKQESTLAKRSLNPLSKYSLNHHLPRPKSDTTLISSAISTLKAQRKTSSRYRSIPPRL